MESRYVKTSSDAVSFSDGKPIAMKVLSPKALHKTKAGLVKLDLRGDKEVAAAFGVLKKKAAWLKPYDIVVQKMAHSGVEAIIGGRMDAQFGPVIMLGLGGIYVEAFKDFALRICPITSYDAEQMIEQLRSKDMITYNGKTKRLVVDLLMKVSKFLVANDDVKELDLNPVIMHEHGYDVVDIRILK